MFQQDMRTLQHQQVDYFCEDGCDHGASLALFVRRSK